MRIAFCLLFLSLVALRLPAQSWSDRYQQAQALYNENKLDEAYQAADDALRKYVADQGAADTRYASLLRLLSVITYSQEKFESGISFAEKEIQIRAQQKDTLYAGALTILSQFQRSLDRSDQAAISLQEARTVLLRYYQEGQEPLIDCDLSLGINYYLSNNFEAAQHFLTSSIQAAEKGKYYTEELMEAMYYLGLLQLQSGQVTPAMKSLTRARELYESSDLTGSDGFPLVLSAQARALALGGDLAGAEQSFSLAQAASEKVSGKKGDDYFGILRNRAANLQRLGKQTESEALYHEISTNPDARSVYVFILAEKAAALQTRGNFLEAEKLYQEAISLLHQDDKESQLTKADMNANLAMVAVEKDELDNALKLLQESRAVMERLSGTNQRKYIAVLNKLGWVQALRGNLSEASDTYLQSFKLLDAMKAGFTPERRSATVGLAEVERKKGRLHAADSIFESVILQYAAMPPDSYLLTALHGLAASQQSQGNFSRVLENLRKSLYATGVLNGKDSPPYGQEVESMAQIHMRVGNMTSAKVAIDSSLAILEKVPGKESQPYASALLTMGKYHQMSGNYTAAEPCYRTARETLRKTAGAKSTDYAAALNSLALLHQVMGNYADALPLLLECKDIYEFRFGKVNAEYSTTLQNLATLYQLEGKLEPAESMLRESLNIDRQTLGENHPQYGIALQNLATLYQKQGRQKEALEMLQQVLRNVEHTLGKEHPSYATTLSNLAALYQDQGNYPLAESTWRQSVELRKKILGEDHPDYARSLYGLAGVYHAQGQWDKAREFYEPVVAKYQKQVVEFFPSLSEKEKSAFYAKIKPVFEAYQDFCIQYQAFKPQESAVSLEKLYNLQLSTKAILLNATNKVRTRIQQSGDTKLQELFREWQASKEGIVRYYNYSQSEREKSGINLATLESRANDLEKQLSEKSDAFRSQFEKETILWKDVQSALNPGEAAVEIIRIKKKYVKDSVYYVGLVIRKESVSPALMIWKLGNQLEARRFRFHRNTIKFHFRDTVSYGHYWASLESRLKGITTVYLSCDGVFNKVNFNSLFNPVTGHYVIDDYTLRQLSNTRELAERKAATRVTGKSAALFGFADFNLGEANTVSSSSKRSAGSAYGFEGADIPVLPATEKEVDGVAGLLNNSSWTVHNYKKLEATEEHVKTVESPRVLHIATHGFFLNDVDLQEGETDELQANPLFRSGVLLAGASVDRSASGRQEDGVLTAYEAMNLNLDDTDLVVLSACETGLGEVRNGEGVYGLQRSFLVAGASTVLMSLWQVDDVATQELMNAFYSNWVQGMELHGAFRKAQLDIKTKYNFPFYWGAFILIGY